MHTNSICIGASFFFGFFTARIFAASSSMQRYATEQKAWNKYKIQMRKHSNNLCIAH